MGWRVGRMVPGCRVLAHEIHEKVRVRGQATHRLRAVDEGMCDANARASRKFQEWRESGCLCTYTDTDTASSDDTRSQAVT